MLNGAGALQPLAVLHVATPLPCWPPKPTAIFTMLGTTAMHSASLMIFIGILLSFASMISVRTVAAVSIRFSISDLSFALSSAAHPELAIISTAVLSASTKLVVAPLRVVFIVLPLLKYKDFFH